MYGTQRTSRRQWDSGSAYGRARTLTVHTRGQFAVGRTDGWDQLGVGEAINQPSGSEKKFKTGYAKLRRLMNSEGHASP